MSIGVKLTGVTTRTVTGMLHGETLPPLDLLRAQNLYCPMPIGLSGVHEVFVVLARTTWPVVRSENQYVVAGRSGIRSPCKRGRLIADRRTWARHDRHVEHIVHADRQDLFGDHADGVCAFEADGIRGFDFAIKDGGGFQRAIGIECERPVIR